ncbi:MAG TPA: FkbM family methyltransferase [Planctomycetota bacterium]|nr:FkbM family methyltransferase [Planctomycetota bacterium]
MRALYRALFQLACVIGRPVGGIRPRRIYDALGRRAFTEAQFSWQRNAWGHELNLSPHYHIDRNIIAFGCYDLELHGVIERLVEPGMICFDVGANLGEMALHMAARAGATGSVYAFEPIPEIFARLKSHVERNTLQNIVRPFQLALSDATGKATIAHADSTASNQGLASLVSTSEVLCRSLEIETMTLDDFVATHAVPRIDLMKIDIQGAEPKLLKGGAKTLQKFAPDLLIEISPEDLKAGGTNSRELCLLIESFGYEIYALKNGKPYNPLRAATVSPDYNATNVLCTKK